MSYLFKIEDGFVVPQPEILLVHPFSEIWERDEDTKKIVAKKELGYIEFMTSMMASNPYRDYSDDRKSEEVKKGLHIDEDWKPDKLVEDGIKYLDVLQTEGSISYRYWLSNKNVLEKQIQFFDEIDLNERNFKTGMPIYKPSDIPAAVEKAEKVLIVINNLKAKVDEELYETNKNKGGKEVSVFATIDSMK